MDDPSLFDELWDTLRSPCAGGVRSSSVGSAADADAGGFKPKNSDKDRFIANGRFKAAAGAQLARIPPRFPLLELESWSVLSPELAESRETELSVFELFEDVSWGDGFSVASGTVTICGASFDSAEEDTMTGRAVLLASGA